MYTNHVSPGSLDFGLQSFFGIQIKCQVSVWQAASSASLAGRTINQVRLEWCFAQGLVLDYWNRTPFEFIQDAGRKQRVKSGDATRMSLKSIGLVVGNLFSVRCPWTRASDHTRSVQ